MGTRFKDLKVGKFFKFGGTLWVKQSSRTARVHQSVTWFYFRLTETVTSTQDPDGLN